MKNQTHFFIYFLLLVALPSLSAQKFDPSKVLGKPIEYDRPIDKAHDYKDSHKFKRSEAPWVVYADRSEENLTRTYSTYKPGRTAMKNVMYKEHYYVIEDKDNWLHIIKGQLWDGLKVVTGTGVDYGWIEKKNLLLWGSGLIDSKTEIHRKAFLLNKATDTKNILKLEKKEKVKILKGPYTGESIGEKTIYEFYFVFKKENNRYLLGKEVNIAPGEMIKSRLIGWVDANRVQDWNTRLALEPNYEKDGFNERKNNESKRVVAYGNIVSAKEHALQGKIQRNNIFWDNDPVKIPSEQLASSNPRRFKGGVIRFPIFKIWDDYYHSGVIGEVTIKTFTEELDKMHEINYSGIAKSVRDYEVARFKYNVLFVVEGTREMIPYKSAIADGVKEIMEKAGLPNVRFGVALYRDTPEKKDGRLFEIQPMTENIYEVYDFLENKEFKSPNDNDQYTAMNYGLNQAILEAGISPNATNIIYLIGNNGDFSADKIRRATAESEGDETLLKSISVAEKLTEVNAHIITIQCRHNSNKESNKFITGGRNFMLETAKMQHDAYKGVKDYISRVNISNPEIVDEGVNKMRLKNGSSVGYLVHPSIGRALTPSEIKAAIFDNAVNVFDFSESFWQKISKIVDDGSSIDNVSPGALEPAVAKVLFDLLAKGGNDKAWSKEDVKKLANNKYRLYTEVFFPTSYPSANEPTYSKVLFMPYSDLRAYVEQLNFLSLALHGTPDERRNELHNTFKQLLAQFTGNNDINMKTYSVEDLRRIMQGLEKEGHKIDLGNDGNLMIEDIQKRKKVSDDQIQLMAERVINNTAELSKILLKGKNYEFSYVSGKNEFGKDNVYFWIPVEYTF